LAQIQFHQQRGQRKAKSSQKQRAKVTAADGARAARRATAPYPSLFMQLGQSSFTPALRHAHTYIYFHRLHLYVYIKAAPIKCALSIIDAERASNPALAA
jgi:hypothetical protein